MTKTKNGYEKQILKDLGKVNPNNLLSYSSNTECMLYDEDGDALTLLCTDHIEDIEYVTDTMNKDTNIITLTFYPDVFSYLMVQAIDLKQLNISKIKISRSVIESLTNSKGESNGKNAMFKYFEEVFEPVSMQLQYLTFYKSNNYTVGMPRMTENPISMTIEAKLIKES